MKSRRHFLHWLLPAFVTAATLWAPASLAQSAAIDPEAVALLRKSTDFIGGLKQFRVDTTSAVELVTAEGQKLQFDHHVIVTVQRPNKLRTDRQGELIKQSFYYDGKSLSANLPEYGFYAVAVVPDTLEGAIDFARDKLDVVAPGADFIYKNAFERLTAGLTSASYIGEAVVAGVRCDHLAFRNPEVDWQICIEQGAKPLPRKFVITSKKMPQAPEFIVVMNRWDTAPKVTDATFTFTPPKGAQMIEFLPAGTAAKK